MLNIIQLPHTIPISSESDVINLRQTLRQIARDRGMGLTRQAKLTAAITTVARTIMSSIGECTYTIQVLHQNFRLWLEISLELTRMPPGESFSQMEQRLQMDNIRLLVDKTSFVRKGSGAFLTLSTEIIP